MTLEQMGGNGAVLAEELERAEIAGLASRSVILVEGASDHQALSALARRQRRDLDTEGITIIATAGATNLFRFVELLGPTGHDVPLAGLCDEGEAAEVRAALMAAGLGASEPGELETLGFFVCMRDL
ncbi:MAG TPA: TOPRIM nucleotidyl transferase/hydrolase domain-containing protein, partial [Acidimicrobiia bacterium]|nr:TOPRIM nucleotidyl transferase/hydrolase domain-containing protein [Acidimicrobiia bacterium]